MNRASNIPFDLKNMYFIQFYLIDRREGEGERGARRERKMSDRTEREIELQAGELIPFA